MRMVLLKNHGRSGFVFYTNTGSRKASDIEETGGAALCFHWKSLRRQVRIEGGVMRVSDREANDYWASRPRDAQIGAWAHFARNARNHNFPLKILMRNHKPTFKNLLHKGHVLSVLNGLAGLGANST